MNFIHKRGAGAAGNDYAVCLDAESLGELKLHNDKPFFAMVSKVEAAAAASNAEREQLEKACGVNHDPHSSLCCPEFRPVIKMPDIYNCDWQHTLASNGVAGTEIAAILGLMQANAALKTRNITLETRVDINPPSFQKYAWRTCASSVLGNVASQCRQMHE